MLSLVTLLVGKFHNDFLLNCNVIAECIHLLRLLLTWAHKASWEEVRTFRGSQVQIPSDSRGSIAVAPISGFWNFELQSPGLAQIYSACISRSTTACTVVTPSFIYSLWFVPFVVLYFKTSEGLINTFLCLQKPYSRDTSHTWDGNAEVKGQPLYMEWISNLRQFKILPFASLTKGRH